MGDALVVTKWIGLYGTAVLAKKKGEALKTYYPAWLVETAAQFEELLGVEKELEIAENACVSGLQIAGRGGIFGALWELAEQSGVGLTVHFDALPLRQETVEICNFLDVNPYQLHAGGSVVFSTSRDEELLACLRGADIPAAVVGRVTAGKDRVLLLGESRRFLEPPRREELEWHT